MRACERSWSDSAIHSRSFSDLQALLQDIFEIGQNAETAERKVISLANAIAWMGGGSMHGQVEAARAVGAGPGGLGMIEAYAEEHGVGFMEAAAAINTGIAEAAAKSESDIAAGKQNGNTITITSWAMPTTRRRSRDRSRKRSTRSSDGPARSTSRCGAAEGEDQVRARPEERLGSAGRAAHGRQGPQAASGPRVLPPARPSG